MKQLVNFKRKKETLEHDIVSVEVFYDREVFLDLPIAAVEFGAEYEKPVLAGMNGGIYIIGEYSKVKEAHDSLRLYHLKRDPETNRVEEVSESEADIHVKLPKNLDLSEIIIKENGSIERISIVKED